MYLLCRGYVVARMFFDTHTFVTVPQLFLRIYATTVSTLDFTNCTFVFVFVFIAGSILLESYDITVKIKQDFFSEALASSLLLLHPF